MEQSSHATHLLKSAAAALVLVLTACDPVPPDYQSPRIQAEAANPTTSASGGRTQRDSEGTDLKLPIGGDPGLFGEDASALGSGAGGAPGMGASSPGFSPSGTNGPGSGGSSATGGSIAAGGSPIVGSRAALACTGKTGKLRGKSSQSVTAAGVSRTFVQYVPEDLQPNEPAPIVIIPHGWTMSGEQMYSITQYHTIADREGFVVLYPDGQPLSIGPWNVGEEACPSNLMLLPTAAGDDQAFVDAMVDFVEAEQCVDRHHIFMTGFSMGGYFSNETGCLRSEIAAIGPHSGGSHELTACASRRKPVILFHGAADGLIPATCGEEARDRWAALNGCGQTTENRQVKNGHCEYSQGCPADGQVVLCLFDGMDHGWAGGAEGAYSFPDYESASELGWSFFKTYAW